MRKIDEKDFASYTICGSGWSVTIHKLLDALKEWEYVKHGTLYGNRPDGTQAILDNR